MTKYTLALVCFLVWLVWLVTACGDNLSGKPDAGGPPARQRAVVVAGDFMQAGVMSVLDLAALEVTQRVAPSGAVGNDPVMRKLGDELFVVNRSDGNNVTILDAKTLRFREQLATGAGSNPQDVAVVGDRLFVPAFGTAGVVVLTRGSGARETIDLSTLDPDGQPNCVSAYAVDDNVYVACELLDANFQPRGPGKVVVIDAASLTVKSTVTMANVNPFGVFERLPHLLGGDLVIPTVSFADVSIGCVERITTGATPAANGCVVTNAALGGFVARIDFQSLGGVPIQWMVVGNGLFGSAARSRLQGYDLGANTLWPAPLSPETELLVDLVVCPNDMIVVADQTMAANGLRVYDGGQETTAAPLAIGLRPGSNHGLACY